MGERERRGTGGGQVRTMASEGRPGLRGVILASNTAGEGTGSVQHGTRGMAPVPPGTVEKKTMFSTKTPSRFKTFANKSNSKLWRFKRGS